MIVQIHTDNNVSGNEDFTGRFSEQITQALNRFSHRVSSFQVHLGDENAKKGGTNDKRCMIEARIDGQEPVAVTCHADSHQVAVNAAIQKIKATLQSTFEKQRKY